MAFPRYPDLRPLALDDAADFDAAFERDPPEISEFTFANLYAWQESYGFEVSFLAPFILVRSAAHNKKFFTPVGAGDKKAAMVQVLRDTAAAFIRVPETIAAAFGANSGFAVTEDRDNADYLYNAAELIALEGRRFDGKRNLIKKFKSAHSFEYVRLDPSFAEQCLRFEEVWCTIKDCESEEGLKNERRAVRRLIAQCEHFNLVGGGIRVNKVICALAIAGRLNPETLVMHVLKADPAMPGLYQVLLNEFLKDQAGTFTFVNLEQDLGIEGLRKSKLSYHPCRMIAKYAVSIPSA